MKREIKNEKFNGERESLKSFQVNTKTGVQYLKERINWVGLPANLTQLNKGTVNSKINQ